MFRTMKMLFAAFSCFFLLAVPLGCSSVDNDNFYDSGANGRSVTKTVGDKFTVRVMVSALSGATWKIKDLDSSVLRAKPNPRLNYNVVVGGLARIYTYFYIFEAVGPGTAQLHMELVKSDTGEVIDTMDMTVVVN